VINAVNIWVAKCASPEAGPQRLSAQGRYGKSTSHEGGIPRPLGLRGVFFTGFLGVYPTRRSLTVGEVPKTNSLSSPSDISIVSSVSIRL